eukprot:242987-Hanusia_phi.AAC.1
MAYMAPPITVVFLGGVLWPRANEQGAWGQRYPLLLSSPNLITACLIFGFLVGNLRLLGEIAITRTHDLSFSSLFLSVDLLILLLHLLLVLLLLKFFTALPQS